jgi:hypothetical protein
MKYGIIPTIVNLLFYFSSLLCLKTWLEVKINKQKVYQLCKATSQKIESLVLENES